MSNKFPDLRPDSTERYGDIVYHSRTISPPFSTYSFSGLSLPDLKLANRASNALFLGALGTKDVMLERSMAFKSVAVNTNVLISLSFYDLPNTLFCHRIQFDEKTKIPPIFAHFSSVRQQNNTNHKQPSKK